MNTCKSCKYYWKEVLNPEAFCVVNPPTPFPMVQQSKIGIPQVAVMSLLPTVKDSKPICEKYSPLVMM